MGPDAGSSVGDSDEESSGADANGVVFGESKLVAVAAVGVEVSALHPKSATKANTQRDRFMNLLRKKFGRMDKCVVLTPRSASPRCTARHAKQLVC